MENTPDSKSFPLPADVLEAVFETWNQASEQHLIPIKGRSMLPLIQSGDQVLVAHGFPNVRVGDVIVFLQSDKIVAHRLLRVCNNGSITTFVTKGDNAPQFDPPVSAHQIVGRVLKIKRGSRWVSIDTPAWRMRGWSIAVGMLVWATVYGWARGLKHRLWGERSNYLTRVMGYSGQRLVSFLLQLIIVTTALTDEKNHPRR